MSVLGLSRGDREPFAPAFEETIGELLLASRRLGRQSRGLIWIWRTVSFDADTPSISPSFSLASVAPKSA